MELKTQPNERRCGDTFVTHRLLIPPCCPISNNPRPGSRLEISYQPHDYMLEVAALRCYVDSYRGGRGPVRSMEGMIQCIAQDCADCIKTPVRVVAELMLDPNQEMLVRCEATPSGCEAPAGVPAV